MANEVTVIEQQECRGRIPAMQAPFLAVQTLSINGVISDAFTGGTRYISVCTSSDCHIELSSVAGVDPDGAGSGSGVVPLKVAMGYVDINVRAGDKIIVVT
jgi:hypothetical protein